MEIWGENSPFLEDAPKVSMRFTSAKADFMLSCQSSVCFFGIELILLGLA